MDKMREEFEGWVRRRGGDVMKRDRDYISSMTREWWQAWQASRAALVVQLPAPCYRAEHVDRCSNDLEWDSYFEIEEVKSALSEAGIKCS